MIDINLIRTNPELVKENIKKKFQDNKLPMVDQAVELDIKIRKSKVTVDTLRAERNQTSSEIGKLMKEKRLDEANEAKKRVAEINNGELKQILEDVMNKPVEELKELYNHREIEK